MRNIILFFSFLFLVVFDCKSQSNFSSKLGERQIVFALSPLVYQGYRYNNDNNNLLRKTTVSSFELRCSYVENLVSDLYLSIGLAAGIVPSKTKYEFDAPINSIFLASTNKNQYDVLEFNDMFIVDGYYALPISLGFNFRPLNKTVLQVELGVKLNMLLAHPSTKTSEHSYGLDSLYSALLFKQELFTKSKYFHSYILKVGLQRKLKNKNNLGLALVANFAPNPIAEGRYSFYNLGFENSGSVTQGASYIGLELGYGLNLTKNRSRGRLN